MIILLFCGVCFGAPAPVSAGIFARHEISRHTEERTPVLSGRKARKIVRLKAKVIEKLEHYAHHDAPDFWLWMGLFCLGLGLCLTLFSATLGGIAGAAGLACLIIWGFFKLGAL
ncbi:MAG: hypothetical protein IPL27_08765 [Lewinellaceae bacterium]|nr:hypothetical protein [Lewinellaceae bacterium]